MRTILLVGEFRGLGTLFQLRGVQWLHCHSMDSLRSESQRGDVFAVIIAAERVTEAVRGLLAELMRSAPTVRRVLLLRRSSFLEDRVPGCHLVLSIEDGVGWQARFHRFCLVGDSTHRRRSRRLCRGGVRLRDSEFATQPRGERCYGQIVDMSAQGIGLRFDQPVAFQTGDFVEIAVKSRESGSTLFYHGQVRWIGRRGAVAVTLGIQFLAVG